MMTMTKLNNSNSTTARVSTAAPLVSAFGGTANIEKVDACITRLRVTVKNTNQVNQKALKELGAAGVLFSGNCAQAVFGTASEGLKEAILTYQNHPELASDICNENLAQLG